MGHLGALSASLAGISWACSITMGQVLGQTLDCHLWALCLPQPSSLHPTPDNQLTYSTCSPTSFSSLRAETVFRPLWSPTALPMLGWAG